ncbi:lymphocyte function-associated antigen 3-like [Brachionichthys hirsutus]|uniref:lymphocyte function-associated antigen 3-like n=1 Tax=Brachionichthys hirsutus TaxID=412623 RepID=UPI003604D53D
MLSVLIRSGGMELRGLVWFLGAALTSVLAADLPSYFVVGGELVLSPASSEVIGDILWKHNKNMLAEWSEEDGFHFYGPLKDRTTLDHVTGQLTVTGMGDADAGEFTVEVNRVLQDQLYKATAIQEVPVPVVWVTPVACGPAHAACTLTCDGNTTEAGPVTYSWRMGGEAWTPGAKDMNVTKEGTEGVPSFSCRMINPVGRKESRPEDNPFVLHAGSGALLGFLLGLVLFLLILFLILIIAGVLILLWKKGIIKRCFGRGDGDSGGRAGLPAEPGRGNGSEPAPESGTQRALLPGDAEAAV